jgi:probable rRNA maturation factor
MSADLTIILETPRWAEKLPSYETIIQTVVNETLHTLGRKTQGVEASIVLADDEFLQGFNFQYRGKNYPTNVLSFPADKSSHFVAPRSNSQDSAADASKVEHQSGAYSLGNGAAEYRAEDLDGELDELDNLGDILISLNTLEVEAVEQKKSFEDHFKHMLVHGVLHLIGYDHQTDEEAHKMESLEVTILQALGVANPYEQTA